MPQVRCRDPGGDSGGDPGGDPREDPREDPGHTSQSHPGLVALPQAAGGTVFPPELVDGAVIPAGTEVLLFA